MTCVPMVALCFTATFCKRTGRFGLPLFSRASANCTLPPHKERFQRKQKNGDSASRGLVNVPLPLGHVFVCQSKFDDQSGRKDGERNHPTVNPGWTCI